MSSPLAAKRCVAARGFCEVGDAPAFVAPERSLRSECADTLLYAYLLGICSAYWTSSGAATRSPDVHHAERGGRMTWGCKELRRGLVVCSAGMVSAEGVAALAF